MKFKLHTGVAAQKWMDIPAHQKGWRDLGVECSWATPYQSLEFARVWYRHYAVAWEPLLIVSVDDEGLLTGLFPLARQDREITGVGAQQAEYQSWLSVPNHVLKFLDGALHLLFETWPDAHLHLRYIDVTNDAGQLLAWAKNRDNVILDIHSRPLLAVDERSINAVLRKRANRSKLNRLKKAGDLVLKSDNLEIETNASLDQIIEIYDFRQGAINNCCPFVDDEFKRDFHLDWLKEAPGQLRAYRILINGRIVAALLGVPGPCRLSNAVFAYSATHARNSPGKLLLYLTAQSLLSSNVGNLDLTPGGDTWKERFATHYDQVYELNAWGDASMARRRRRRYRIEASIRRALGVIGLPPSKLRSWIAFLRRVRPLSIWNAVRKFLPLRTEYRIYQMHLDNLVELPAAQMPDAGPEPRIDALGDLVYFSPTATWQSRQDFLSTALKRIEHGERVYSARAGGSLLHYGWRVRKQSEAFFTEVGTKYAYPEPGAVFYDFFTHPHARGQGWYQRTLAYMLRDLDRESVIDEGPRVVYISVLAGNGASRHVIEKLGFRHLDSLIRVSAFGWSRCDLVPAADK